jgi:hypothetical protein
MTGNGGITMTTLPITRLGALLALALVSVPAAAHEDAALAKLTAPHGGQLKVAGDWHLELVQEAGATNTLLVYVTDHDGRPIATQDMTGAATVLAGKTKASAELRPDGANRLRGGATYDAGAGPKVVVRVTAGGGRSEQARFVLTP